MLDPPLNVIQLTPPGRGAIAVLRIEGPGALETVQRDLHCGGQTPLSAQPIGRLVLGRFGEAPGEEIVLRRRMDNAIELCCHGGLAAADRIIHLLCQEGAAAIDWRTWLAAQPGDPIAAAAQLALADARTERTAAILLDQYHGALRRTIQAILAALDQQQAETARTLLDELLRWSALGRHLVQPWRVAVAGPPNAGKSSLINALLGYCRAIVLPTPGTTRDVLTTPTVIDGWPVELADTAGQRSTDDRLEEAGIERARRRIAASDLTLLVFDRSRASSPEEQGLARQWPEAVLVQNKCDLPAAAGWEGRPGLAVSALTGEAIDVLWEQIARRLVPGVPPAGAAVPFTPAQVAALEAARRAIEQGDPASAARAVGDEKLGAVP